MSADEHGAGRVSQGHGDELRCRSGPGAGACAGTGAGIPHADKDPVCGMDVDPHTTAHRATLDGRSYYFCSRGCRVRFLASPATYLDRNGGAAEPVPEGTMSHASRGPAGCAGHLPDLRDGIGAHGGEGRGPGPTRSSST